MDKNELISLKTVIDGSLDRQVLLFIHGYPDDESLWDMQVAFFKDRFCCLRVVLPNYGGEIDRPGGFDFHEVVDLIKKTLDRLNLAESPVILVTHDWGAAYGYYFEKQYPHLVRQMIALDVGGTFGKQTNPLGYVMIPFYQLNLALALIFCQIPGIGLSLGNIWSGFTFKTLSLIANKYVPEGVEIRGPSRKNPFSAFQNYPYFYAWKQVFGLGKSPKIREGFSPRCPVLYAYGCKGIKGFMSFHDREWLERLERNPACKVVAFETAGHWLMRDNPEKLHELMDSFLSQKDT